jgi:glutamyl/glutaminyl-tRNA synthetase
MITRFAPTPSGYLHAGNAVNALLVAWLARANDGAVAVRIDDMDAARYRSQYVDDVFDVLAWLGVEWQLGPTSSAEFDEQYSLRRRTEYYRSELRAAADRGLELYACRCSRSQLIRPPTGGCPGGCREAGHAFVVGESAIRAHVPGDVCPEMGDVVLWRRDDLPAYHLASVIEDRDLGVTHVVRGDDLRPSTAIQLHLARYLDAASFTAARFVHHGLLTDETGAKLSKSVLTASSTRAGPLLRTSVTRESVANAAREIGARVGITPPR